MDLKLSFFLFGTALLTLVSCGGNKKNNHPMDYQAEVVVEPIIEKGIYRANLRSINPKVLPSLNGTTLIKVRGNEFIAETFIRGASPNTVVRQYIHDGTSCPALNTDSNDDGYIDALEGSSAYGNPFLPLDGDVGSLTRGEEVFPHTNFRGEFKYSEFSPLNSLMDELKTSLVLTNKLVVLYGASTDLDLPSSVGTTRDLSPHATLPIACGEIIKVGEEYSSAGKKTL
jgi:hypothetical protein